MQNSKSLPLEKYMGLQLKKRRKYLKFTQYKLANLLQISGQQLSKYESGKDKIPPDRLQQLCQLLEVTPNYFFKNENKLELSSIINYNEQEICFMQRNIQGQTIQITLEGKISNVKVIQEER